MPYKIGVYTLGCKVSQYESEAILEEALRCGFSAAACDRECDICIVNSCTVTAESDRKCRQLIRRLASRAPNAKILVCGCYAQTDPEQLAALKDVDYISGTLDKIHIIERARELLSGKALPKINVRPLAGAPFESMRIEHAPRTRAYVKIEDGCENRCAYCIIPKARGPVRSKKISEALDEICGLAKSGVREVVLTGIETASFGADTGEQLGDLLAAADNIDGLARIRLGSLEPTLFRPDFIRQISNLKKLAPHFHLSLQSGCSKTLDAMRRKYNAKTAMQTIQMIRAALPDAQLTADFIVGFPGETEEDFEQTLTFAKEARLLSAHIFKYSKRADTPAADFPDQVPEAVKHARSERLIACCAANTQACLCAQTERHPIQNVLFEQIIDGLWAGHTASFIEVRVRTAENLHGKLLPVRVIECGNGYLIGELNTPETRKF